MKAPLDAGAPGAAFGNSDALTARRNLRLLIDLRWIAVAGQIASIAVVALLFGAELPLGRMALVVGGLVVLNLAGLLRLRSARRVSNGEILAALLIDVGALSLQLFLSGGTNNPFAFLFVLQLALGALMLGLRPAAILLCVTLVSVFTLTFVNVPLPVLAATLWGAVTVQTFGLLICFAITAVLVVVFVNQVSDNIRERDKRLADLRQRAAEEDHIVRMGLLASGAAHELGTPLSTLAIILGDWRRMPALRDAPDLVAEIKTMQAEVARCKAIVSGILLSAGEARGESAQKTTAAAFFDELADEWRRRRPDMEFDYRREGADDLAIVLDSTLRQAVVNVLENAFEVSPDWIGFTVTMRDDMLTIRTEDCGPGFDPAIRDALGRPYQSTKGRPGRGLGLFFAVNTLRKLGGNVEVGARAGGGAMVTLLLPLKPLTIDAGAP